MYNSLNALFSLNADQTMRVKGLVGNQVIHIFIDSGSTYNFLDSNNARRLGCKLITTCPLRGE